MTIERLNADFFKKDVLEVAPALLNKFIARQDNSGICRYKITEVEAYRGIEDLACHASKGKTKRTTVMFDEGGKIYVYLIYGMYWMLNFVTEKKDNPQAVLIRGVEKISGPGKVGKALNLDKSFYGEDLETSARLWVEDNNEVAIYETSPRIGIDYAGEPWVSKPWRYVIK